MKRMMIPIGVTTGIAILVLGFQNCGDSPKSSASSVAASCLANSVMGTAYPSGTSFTMALGVSNSGGIPCTNGSTYNTITFTATNQTITLSGSGNPVTFALYSGGAGCSSKTNLGGDHWQDSGGDMLQTTLTTSTLQIVSSADGVSCSIPR